MPTHLKGEHRHVSSGVTLAGDEEFVLREFREPRQKELRIRERAKEEGERQREREKERQRDGVLYENKTNTKKTFTHPDLSSLFSVSLYLSMRLSLLFSLSLSLSFSLVFSVPPSPAAPRSCLPQWSCPCGSSPPPYPRRKSRRRRVPR